MPRRDWALLAIAYGNGQALTPVQLQKSLFLLGRNMPGAVGYDFYEFTPYNYGPFDSRVYADAEQLAREGLVSVERAIGRSWVGYAATPQGTERARTLRTYMPLQACMYLEAVVTWARRLSFQQLVAAIYDRYPDQRVNSVFRD